MPNPAAIQILTKLDRNEFTPVLRDLTRAWLGDAPTDIEPAAQALFDTRLTFGELSAITTDSNVMNRAGIYPEHVRAMLSTGDYSRGIESGMNLTMVTSMNEMLGPVLSILRPVTVESYQPVGLPRCDVSEFPHRAEGAEIPYASVEYSGEVLTLQKYAQILLHTRESLLTGEGFQMLQAELVGLAQAAARRIVSVVSLALGANPKLKDTWAWFDPTFGNDLTGGFDISSLSAATAALAEMQNPAGDLPVGIKAKFLIVSPTVEQEARTMLSATALEQGAGMRVVPVAGLDASTFFVCGGGDNLAIAMGQLEDGPLSVENVTEQSKRAMNPIDAESWRGMLEFAITPASRHIVRTTVV